MRGLLRGIMATSISVLVAHSSWWSRVQCFTMIKSLPPCITSARVTMRSSLECHRSLPGTLLTSCVTDVDQFWSCIKSCSSPTQSTEATGSILQNNPPLSYIKLSTSASFNRAIKLWSRIRQESFPNNQSATHPSHHQNVLSIHDLHPHLRTLRRHPSCIWQPSTTRRSCSGGRTNRYRWRCSGTGRRGP